MNAQKTHTCQLLSAKELAKILSTSVRSTWRYRSSGKLPQPVKIGIGAIRWRLSDIELFLECDCDMQRFEAMKQAKGQ